MTISTNFTFNLALSQMQDMQSSISRTQGQLATGELVASPSDSPDTTATTQRIQTAIARQDSFSQSLTQVDNRFAAQETAISSTAGLLTRIKELSIEASNDTVSSQDRKNIALELRQRGCLGRRAKEGVYIVDRLAYFFVGCAAGERSDQRCGFLSILGRSDQRR